MKKLILLLAVCGFALAFVACGKKAETAVDGTPATTEELVDSISVDSAAVLVDSAAAQ